MNPENENTPPVDERMERLERMRELEAELEKARLELEQATHAAKFNDEIAQSAFGDIKLKNIEIERLKLERERATKTPSTVGSTIAMVIGVLAIAAGAAAIIWFQHKYPYRAELIG